MPFAGVGHVINLKSEMRGKGCGFCLRLTRTEGTGSTPHFQGGSPPGACLLLSSAGIRRCRGSGHCGRVTLQQSGESRTVPGNVIGGREFGPGVGKVERRDAQLFLFKRGRRAVRGEKEEIAQFGHRGFIAGLFQPLLFQECDRTGAGCRRKGRIALGGELPGQPGQTVAIVFHGGQGFRGLPGTHIRIREPPPVFTTGRPKATFRSI